MIQRALHKDIQPCFSVIFSICPSTHFRQASVSCTRLKSAGSCAKRLVEARQTHNIHHKIRLFILSYLFNFSASWQPYARQMPHFFPSAAQAPLFRQDSYKTLELQRRNENVRLIQCQCYGYSLSVLYPNNIFIHFFDINTMCKIIYHKYTFFHFELFVFEL